MDKIEREVDVSCPIHFHLFHQHQLGKDPRARTVADPAAGVREGKKHGPGAHLFYRPQTKLRECNVFTGGVGISCSMSCLGWISLVPGPFWGVGISKGVGMPIPTHGHGT